MNALEALKVYFPNIEGPVGPYGLLVGLAYLEENPATEPHRREELMALLDSIAPLAETLKDDQLAQLEEVIHCFFRLGATLVVPHLKDQKIKEGIYERSIGKRNKVQNAVAERGRAVAIELWNGDTKEQIRTSEMADIVYKKLISEGYRDQLPGDVDGVKVWIRPVAPAYAKKPGRKKS